MRFAVLIIVLAACESGSAKPRPPSEKRDGGIVSIAIDAAPVASGDTQAAYTKLCAPCHGVDGKGYAADFAPSLVNPMFLESATDDFLRRSIVFGRPGTSMGAYGRALGGPLDDEAVDKLVGWMRERGGKPKQLPAFAGGDAAKGAAFYAEYCKTCHGDTTKRGEAPHLANPRFLEIATDSFIRYAIEFGRPGTKMNAFGAVMTAEQLNDVTAYVRTLSSAVQLHELPPPTGTEPLVINPKGREPVWKPREGKFIGVDAVAKALKEKRKMIIIDARPSSDWRRVHVEGAVSIPYHDMKRLDEVLKLPDVYVISYCACPHHLSGIVQEELAKRGHKKSLILDEGINLWHQKGYPVTAAEGVTAPVLEPQNPPLAPH